MKTTLAMLLILELYGLSSALVKQHFFVNEKKTWFAAKIYCNIFYHDLSSFTTESEEQQFLEDTAHQTSDAWVGLHKESGVWKWSGGQNATYINWDSKQPEDDDCVFLHKGRKKLNDIACTDKYTFFCMNLSVFALIPENETWEGALEYCRKHYNDLASLSSKNRMNSALQGISQTQTEYVWTGLHFLTGEWLWVTGDDLDYTAWPETGQPKCPARNLWCGALGNKTKTWTHRDCEEKLNFFCSVDAEGGVATVEPSQTTAQPDN